MRLYAARRLLAALPLLWLVWSLTFIAGRLAPGGPMALYDSPGASRAALDRLSQAYGLTDPLPTQYLKQLLATLGGNLAISTSQGRPVAEIVLEAIGPTLLLTSLALILQFIIGIGLGLLSVCHPRGRLDHGLSSALLVCYSVPSFWLGVQLVAIFSYRLGWFPSSHMRSVPMPGETASLGDLLRHLALPLLTLSLGGVAAIARHARGGLLESVASDFALAARSRGLPAGRILLRHVLGNSLLPILALAGLSLPFLLSGAAVVEVIFAWPGLGQVAYNAILARDYPVVQATTLLAATLVIVGGLGADLLAAAVDPRVRLGAKEGG